MSYTVKIKTYVEKEIKYFRAVMGVRYWEDATINGKDALDDGSDTPLKVGDYWTLDIDVDTGQILNWPEGTAMDTHYKVCDDGSYFILDSDFNEIEKFHEIYVPSVLYPKARGYGDYVILDIDKNGYIKDWNFRHFIDWLEDRDEEI